MIHRNGQVWLGVAFGLAAVGIGGSAFAQSTPDIIVDPPSRTPGPATESAPPVEPETSIEREAPQEPEACDPDCRSDCNCMQGINVTRYKNVIFLNFASTLAGRIELEYDRALHRRVSIFAAAYAVAFDSILSKRLVGYGWLVGARVFAVGGAPEGLWFAWELGQFYRNARGNRNVKLSAFQTGGMMGWTGIWKRFALTLGAGAQYTVGRVLVGDESAKEGEWWPWFKLGMGVAF